MLLSASPQQRGSSGGQNLDRPLGKIEVAPKEASKRGTPLPSSSTEEWMRTHEGLAQRQRAGIALATHPGLATHHALAAHHGRSHEALAAQRHRLPRSGPEKDPRPPKEAPGGRGCARGSSAAHPRGP